ncbi:MAG: c-type cytochrome, partial [Planctomycetaceae bacterium]
MRFRLLWIVAVAGLVPVAAFAQSEEDDFPPGLLAKYTAGGKTIERIDPDVAFDWQDAAPDERLPRGPFSAEWTSLLLIRQDVDYTFHAFVQGEATVTIDGQTVLRGKSDEAGWISGTPIKLGFGEKDLAVTFKKTEDRAALKLFWSSDAFYREPLPYYLLFRDGGREDLAKIERGRLAFDAHRCGRCHRREEELLAPSAPALVHLDGLDRDWLISKIENPQASPHARMPSFGFTHEEAAAIAAFLLDRSKPVDLDEPGKSKDASKDRRAGEVLFRSVGCLACHSIGEEGETQAFDGGDLSNVGGKRSVEWLTTWLRRPEKLNPDHRMPVFSLSKDERRQLALYLSSLQQSTEPGRVGPDRGDTP